MVFPFTGRLELLWLLIVETSWAYFVLLRFPKGLTRLLGLLPLVPPSLLVPWRAPTVCERMVLSFFVLWLVGTKLLMFVWDTGPAADPTARSTFPRFFLAISSAVHLKRARRFSSAYRDQHHDVPKDGSLGEVEGKNSRVGNSDRGSHGGRTGEDDGRNGSLKSGTYGLSSGRFRRKSAPQGHGEGLQGDGKKVRETPKGWDILKWVQMVRGSQTGWIVLLRSMCYCVLGSFVVRALAWKPLMSEYVVVFLLLFGIYLGCLVVFEMAGAIAGCLLGVEVPPQFNMPFLADSLADFWGRRWNLLVNNLLRVSVYEPVLGLLNGRTKPAPWERAVATAITFLVSGLMHEVVVFYGSRGLPSWEMTAYFVVNGAATIVEGFVLKPGECCRVPRLLRQVYTLSFVYLTACWLFFPPLFRTGMVNSILEETRMLASWLSFGMIIL